MIETVFFMDAMAIKIKRIAKLIIENEVRLRIFYSSLFDSSSTNRMQPEVKPYKAKPYKAKSGKAKTKVACGDNTQS